MFTLFALLIIEVVCAAGGCPIPYRGPLACDQGGGANPPSAATRPSPAAGQLTAFQPGVWIDWQQREVHVQARVVLRSGALEFLACWSGKEHESIVRFEAAAGHVYQALGLIGLVPGHPPVFDSETGRVGPPAGDLVDISFRWAQDGQTHTADAFDWLQELEYGRAPLPRPWVLAGSLRLPDGTLSADATGVGIAVVDFPDSLICYSRRFSSRNSELWVVANTPAIPPEGTPVRIVLRPARPRPHRAALDFRGEMWLDGRYCSPADFADIVELSRRLDPAYVQPIIVQGTLRSDERRLRRALEAADLPAEVCRFVRDGR